MSKLWLKLLSTPKGKVFFKTAVTSTSDIITSARLNGKSVGSMRTMMKAGVAHVEDVRVTDQGIGIGKKIFSVTMQKAHDLGAKYMRGMSIINPKQINVRQNFKTKFLARYTGRYAEGAKIVGGAEAKAILHSNERGHFKGAISAVTKIPDDINALPRPKLPSNKRVIKFVRINGRIIPIRNK